MDRETAEKKVEEREDGQSVEQRGMWKSGLRLLATVHSSGSPCLQNVFCMKHKAKKRVGLIIVVLFFSSRIPAFLNKLFILEYF